MLMPVQSRTVWHSTASSHHNECRQPYQDQPHSSRQCRIRPESKADQKPAETALPGELISAGSQQLHRKLGGKEIQLFAVGGAIGTCMLLLE